ncbi:hypothetical protein [Mesobacillus thioparans]|uniref:Uncharacterized protein n=1 Tax=Mesobacillus subterraneus TaxID=285983 RepID=A0A0D6ZEZ3_9BACI|nr:hypothetical protein UB32_01450 [Mesobacillus subterraneus]
MVDIRMLNLIKVVGGLALTIGCVIFLFGFFGSDSKIVTAVGIGTIGGSVIIFLMGMFFVVSEEVLKKTNK